MDPQYGIFWSYAHHDNRHDQRRVVLLAELLESELRSQGVYNFPIWLDRVSIKWGDDWKQKILEGVRGSVFFIPVVSPAWYESQVCMEEIDTFMRNEHLIGGGDYILPIHYIDTTDLDPPHREAFPDVKPTIDARQWQCWRDFRFEDPDSPEVRKTLAGMAISIRERLGRIKDLRIPTPYSIGDVEPSTPQSLLLGTLLHGLAELRERLTTYSASSNLMPQKTATRLDCIAEFVQSMLETLKPENPDLGEDMLEGLFDLQEELRLGFEGADGREIRQLLGFDQYVRLRHAVAAMLAFDRPVDPELGGFDNAIESALQELVAALDQLLDGPVEQPRALQLLRLSCQRWLDERRVEFDTLDRRMAGLVQAEGMPLNSIFRLSAALMGKGLDKANRIPGAIFMDEAEDGFEAPLVAVIPGGVLPLPTGFIQPFGLSLVYWSEREPRGDGPSFIGLTERRAFKEEIPPLADYHLHSLLYSDQLGERYRIPEESEWIRLLVAPPQILARVSPIFASIRRSVMSFRSTAAKPVSENSFAAVVFRDDRGGSKDYQPQPDMPLATELLVYRVGLGRFSNLPYHSERESDRDYFLIRSLPEVPEAELPTVPPLARFFGLEVNERSEK